MQRALESVEERQRWDRINRHENPALEQERRRVEIRLRELLDTDEGGGDCLLDNRTYRTAG